MDDLYEQVRSIEQFTKLIEVKTQNEGNKMNNNLELMKEKMREGTVG